MAEQQHDSQGWPLQCNLDDEFVRVDNHDVYKTPSANLTVAANELAQLPQTPEVTAMLKAAHCQVNEIYQEQRPSYSTTSIHRSATTRTASPTSTATIGNPSRAELGATTPNIPANTTRRSTRTFGCTSTISEMHNDVSTNVALVAMKMKYAAARSTSKSTVTQT